LRLENRIGDHKCGARESGVDFILGIGEEYWFISRDKESGLSGIVFFISAKLKDSKQILSIFGVGVSIGCLTIGLILSNILKYKVFSRYGLAGWSLRRWAWPLKRG